MVYSLAGDVFFCHTMTLGWHNASRGFETLPNRGEKGQNLIFPGAPI
jgi:hypothetical protein